MLGPIIAFPWLNKPHVTFQNAYHSSYLNVEPISTCPFPEARTLAIGDLWFLRGMDNLGSDSMPFIAKLEKSGGHIPHILLTWGRLALMAYQ